MIVRLHKLCILVILLATSLSMMATHYINHTGKTIIVTNVTAAKGTKKSFLSYFKQKHNVQPQAVDTVFSLELENDQESDLDNHQGDEITITSPGMSDKRKLFPTNNSFNYVITLNNYSSIFEKFDINHAGNEKVEKVKKAKLKKVKKAKFKKIAY